ncbi:hypothetical protein EV191_109214 [Tamaricihabitans halophyticus]|uniref:Uncharacterized protein n=1 Tax=Tamaricihabitans halophyticus TaxID=1262583 RepID=A0A4R2QJ53_9PSEU|nr:DUF5336 domain-containing protein [Tamaricihabitans halophyticus]TCP49392.1 hypothetical protein EV191_109214 [Tamaricihabitans halophyticus]
MTYSSGGQGGFAGHMQQGGYGQQPAGFQPGPQAPQGAQAAPNPLAKLPLSALLAAVVGVLSLITYFCGFTAGAAPGSLDSSLLLTGGLLAALYLVPNAPKVLPVAVVLSVVGGLGLLRTVVQTTGASAMLVVMLVLGLLQAGVAVVALLFDMGVVKTSGPKPSVAAGQSGSAGPAGQPMGAQGYPATGVFPPVEQFGSPEQAASQERTQQHSAPAQQNQAQQGQGQFVVGNADDLHGQSPQQGSQQGQLSVPPASPGMQQGQQTLYASHQGQFSQQPPPGAPQEGTEPPKKPTQ